MSHNHKLINPVNWEGKRRSSASIETREGPRKRFDLELYRVDIKEQILHFEDQSDTVQSLGHLGTHFNLVLTKNFSRALFS